MFDDAVVGEDLNSLLVSVVMPVFNAADTVIDSIHSVIQQSHQNWELLVVDDGSTDGSPQLIESTFSDARVRVVRSNARGGAAQARNTAISLASGRFVAFLDADDLWLPQKLEQQVALMLTKGAPIAYCAYRKMTEEGQIGDEVVRVPPELDYEQLLRGNVMGCLTVMFDRQCFPFARIPLIQLKAGFVKWQPWFPGGVIHEDYACWLALLREARDRGFGVAVGIDRPLAVYRVRSHSRSSNKARAALAQWIIYRQEERLGLLKSLWCFANYAMGGIRKHAI